jgi:hypothetical protein
LRHRHRHPCRLRHRHRHPFRLRHRHRHQSKTNPYLRPRQATQTMAQTTTTAAQTTGMMRHSLDESFRRRNS